ncbi:uncharacterized protein LOC141899481 [Tubulanus polymorphus]|uniref:uncharacterized protein LOC141899481 n=1 Tax=Tubulanus polymorphus TaxID=672921 RepID=UPI003DA1E0F5
MKISLVALGFVVCAFSAYMPATSAIDPATAAQIAKFAIPFVKDAVVPFVGKIFDVIFGDNKYADDILAGRAIRVTKIGETGCTVKDRGTGISISMADGQFPSAEQAVGKACEELVTKLLTLGVLSPENLGIPVPTTTTTKPCHNNMVRSMCNDYQAKGYCEHGSAFWEFMMHNCYETCGCDRPTQDEKNLSLLEQLKALQAGLS